jgi:hypothetical protein
MVNAIKKFGLLKSLLTASALLLGLVTGVYQFNQGIQADMGVLVDGKIKVHKLQSDLELGEKIHEIQMQQNTMDGKLNTIIERLPE